MLTKYDEGLAAPPMSKWEPDDITALLEYLRALNQELIESGELIEAHALTGPELAKIVVTNGSGPPVITPGYSAASDRGGSDSVPVDAAVEGRVRVCYQSRYSEWAIVCRQVDGAFAYPKRHVSPTGSTTVKA